MAITPTSFPARSSSPFFADGYFPSFASHSFRTGVMNVSSDALNTKESNDERARNDNQNGNRQQKKSEGQQESARAKNAATPKKTGKATKSKRTAKSGSTAAIVLDLIKRKVGATLGRNRQSDRLAEPQHSGLRQRARDEEARTEG